MTRKKACEVQVRLCLAKARADESLRQFWQSEAIKWQRRADDEIGGIFTYEIKDGRLQAQPKAVRRRKTIHDA